MANFSVVMAARYRIELSEAQGRELRRRAEQHTRPHREVVRADVVLLSAEVGTAAEIAERLDCTGGRPEVWLDTQSTITRRPGALRAGDESVGVGEGLEGRVHVGVVRMS